MAIYDYQGHAISGTGMVSVKDYGAKGNGTTDDKNAIQSALDALKTTGGIIFFPNGIYLITDAVMYYSNQTIIFENGAKLLQGAAVNSLMRPYHNGSWGAYNGVHDVVIYGAVFDGGNYTTSNTLLATFHSKNILIDRCQFYNGYGSWHNIEINSSYNVTVKDCILDGTRRNSGGGEMIQVDAATIGGYPWASGGFDNTVCKFINIVGNMFQNSTHVPAIGCHSDAAHEYIRIMGNNFVSITAPRGAIDFTESVYDVDISENIFSGCTIGVDNSEPSYYIHDNRFVGATSAIVGDGVAHANIINGTYTA